MMTDPITSHGRGGAGNIEPDSKIYTDGEITRQGPIGDQGDGTYSAGRGGAGNISSPHIKPSNPAGHPGDHDVVPATAMRGPGQGAGYEKFHTGRGGEGNIHKEQHRGGKVEELKEKVMHPFGGGSKE